MSLWSPFWGESQGSSNTGFLGLGNKNDALFLETLIGVPKGLFIDGLEIREIPLMV